MSSILEITKAEFDEAIREELGDIVAEAEKQFQRRIDEYGIRLTDELRNSFRSFILNHSVTMAAKVTVEFEGYGRFRDMKRLQWRQHIPPVGEMEWFVAKTGLDKFQFLNGYKRQAAGWFATDAVAIRRLAWSIAMSRRKFPSVKRKYRGSWYNSEKGVMLKNVRDRLRWRIQSAVTTAMRDEYARGA